MITEVKTVQTPKAKIQGTLFAIAIGAFFGGLTVYSSGRFHDYVTSNTVCIKRKQHHTSPTNINIRGTDTSLVDVESTSSESAKAFHEPEMMPKENMLADSSSTSTVATKTCLDPNGPLPVVIMSLGRSGTDCTWDVLRELTNSSLLRSLEIAGSYNDESTEFFKWLDGVASFADDWTAPPEDYDWRTVGGGTEATRGFHDHIRSYCANQACKDGRWITDKWFCEVQKQYLADTTEGLVSFKWKASLPSMATDPAKNALRLLGSLAYTNTPIKVVRSRRNPFDVFLSMQKHSQADLPDHCNEDDTDCIKKHTSIKVFIPLDEMENFLTTTVESEDDIDAMLSELGVPTIHVDYDDMYYPPSDEAGAQEWNKISRFLGKRNNWTWADISGAAKLKPTTKTRNHKVLVRNFDEVYGRLKGTKFERFLRINE